MDSDLISKKTLLDLYDGLEFLEDADWDSVWNVPLEVVVQNIKDMPTVDAVEVVRCEDCRLNVANMETDPLDATDYSDITCSYFKTDGMEPDDFCSRGENMDGGDEE